MNPRVFLLFIILGLLTGAAFAGGRRSGRHSPASRRKAILLAVGGIVTSVIIAFGVPEWIPMNRESPAGVIVYFGCWLIGGTSGLVCIATLAGALSARPAGEMS